MAGVGDDNQSVAGRALGPSWSTRPVVGGSGAEDDAGGGALESARRTALLRRSGCRRSPTQGLSGHSSHELKGVPEPVTLFRLVRASGGGRRSGQRPQDSLSFGVSTMAVPSPTPDGKWLPVTVESPINSDRVRRASAE
jgi:hypothetical protein